WARAHGWKRLRINAHAVEQMISGSLHQLLNDPPRLRSCLIDSGVSELDLALRGAALSSRLSGLQHDSLRAALRTIIERIEVSPEHIKIQLRATDLVHLLAWDRTPTFRRGARRHKTNFILLSVPCLGVARLAQTRVVASRGSRRGRRNPAL